MHILVIGDSYCQHTQEGSWINDLRSGYKHQVIAASFPGQGWWHQRRWLLSHQNDFHAEVLIVIHPSNSRIHSTKDEVLNQGSMFSLDEKYLTHTQRLAKQVYLSDLYDPTFQTWALKRWILEIAHTQAQKYQKVIQVLGSEKDNSMFGTTIDRTICVTTPLIEVSDSESTSGELHGDTRLNHMSRENNQRFAEFINALVVSEQRSGEVSWPIPV